MNLPQRHRPSAIAGWPSLLRHLLLLIWFCAGFPHARAENLLELDSLSDEERGENGYLPEGAKKLGLREAFPIKEGSFSCWVKPIDWDATEADFVYLASTGNEDLSWSLYKYRIDGNRYGLCVLYGRPDSYAFFQVPMDDWVKNQWRHVIVTWSQNDRVINLWIDGNRVASTALKETQLPSGEVQYLSLGSANLKKGGGHFQTAFRELELLNRMLSPEEIAQRKTEPAASPIERLSGIAASRVTIPYLSNPPKIDGSITPGEWDQMAKVVGGMVAGEAVIHPGQTFSTLIGYDKERLYLLLLSAGDVGILRAEVRENAQIKVVQDDSIELFFAPSGDPWQYFQFIGNSTGFHYLRHIDKVLTDSGLEYQSSVHEGTWIAELSIPFKTLGTTPTPGTRWLGNFVRNWRSKEPGGQTSWSYTPESFFSHMGEIIFGGEAPFYRMELDTNLLEEGIIKGNLDLINGGEEKAEATLTLQQGAAIAISQRKEDFPQEGEHERRISFEQKLPAGNASNLLITAGEGYRQSLPLAVASKTRFRITTDLKTESITLEAPTLGAARALIKLIDSDGKQRLEHPTQPDPQAANFTQTLSLKELPAGFYTIQLEWFSATQEKIGAHQQRYDHLGKAEWLQWSQLPTKVPTPWTPIAYDAATLGFWGRTYQLQSTPFPGAMQSQQKAITRAPVQLAIQLDGANAAWSQPPQWREQGEVAGLYVSTSETPTARITATTHIEFDGLWYVSLEVTPLSEKATLEELAITLPFSPEIARLIYAHGGGVRLQGFLKDHLPSNYASHLWIGDDEAGLTWFTESNQHWSHRNPDQVFEVTHSNAGTDLKINVVDKPLTLTGPVRYLFGLQATPTRQPLSASARHQLRFGSGSKGEAQAAFPSPWQVDLKLKPYHEKKPYDFCDFHVTSPADLKAELLRWRERGLTMPWYIAPNIISTRASEWEIFADQWRNPHGPYEWGCVNSSSALLQNWTIDRLVKEADLRAVYVDCALAYPCGNEKHGCGYRDAEGVLHTTTPYLALRRYLMSLYTSLHESEPIEGTTTALLLHMSAGINSAVHGFADLLIEGEELVTRLPREPNYFSHYPPDTWRAIFGPQFGSTSILLPALRGENMKSIPLNDAFLTQALLSNTPIWNIWGNPAYINGIYNALDRWGLRNPQLTFSPYHQQKAVNVEGGDLHVSLYQLPGKAVLAVGNFTKEKQQGAVMIQRDQLQLPAGEVRAFDLLTGIPLSLSDLVIEKESFRLIALETAAATAPKAP